MSNVNEPAFPTAVGKDSDFGYSTGGLSKREYIAAQIFSGAVDNFTCGAQHLKAMAKYSVEAADALLAELEGA